MNCHCGCHAMGSAFARCTGEYADGGCGHMHRTSAPVDFDALAAATNSGNRGLLLGAGTPAPRPEVATEPARPVERPRERPAGACLTHHPPQADRGWRRADPGYRTCSACYDRLHRWLSPTGMDEEGRPDNIAALYLSLDASRGNPGPGRRAPGFASTPPGSDHVMAMRDARTVQVDRTDPCSATAILRAWVTYVWDERYDSAALERRDYPYHRRALPTAVDAAVVWLDRQLDWLTRREVIAELDIELRELHRQLRSATGGAPSRPVGHCIEILVTGECGAPIYMPRGEKPRAPDEPIVDLPELTCAACGSSYTGRRLILLRLAEEQAARVRDAAA